MLAFAFKDVVGVGPVSQVFNLDSGFFKYFSAGTIFYGFVKFQMAAWKRPGTVAMGILAFAKKNFVILDYNDGNTDKRSFGHIKITWKNYFHHENTKYRKHEIYLISFSCFRPFVLS